jgi:hypothetical protein
LNVLAYLLPLCLLGNVWCRVIRVKGCEIHTPRQDYAKSEQMHFHWNKSGIWAKAMGEGCLAPRILKVRDGT